MSDPEADLRICYLSPYPPEKEGVADYLEALLDALPEAGASATVICQSVGDGVEEARDGSVRVLRIWKPDSVRSLLRIRKLLGSPSFTCVHLEFGPYAKYGGFAGEPLLVAFLLLKGRVPSVVTLHSLWLRGQLRDRLRERYGWPAWFAGLASAAFREYLVLLLRQFERIVLLSNAEDPALTSTFCREFRVDPGKVVQWTHPCVDKGTRPPRAPPTDGESPGPLRVVCPGFISPRKGLEVLLAAVADLTDVPPFSLRIVGECLTDEDRAYLAALRRSAAQLPQAARVEFVTEGLRPATLDDEVAAADVLVLTHAYRVGPSGLLCRFMRLGIPTVVTSDPLFLPDSSKGPWVVVPPQDAARLREALRELLTSPDRRQELSRSSRSWAARHSYREQAAAHLELYRGLVQRPPG